MRKTAKGTFTAKIPPQKAKQIVRFRLRATDAKNAERFFPHPNELRPALSVYVHEPFKLGEIPFGLIINVGANEFRAAKQGIGPPGGGFGGPQPNPPGRGNSAFVWIDPRPQAQLWHEMQPAPFDFLRIPP